MCVGLHVGLHVGLLDGLLVVGDAVGGAALAQTAPAQRVDTGREERRIELDGTRVTQPRVGETTLHTTTLPYSPSPIRSSPSCLYSSAFTFVSSLAHSCHSARISSLCRSYSSACLQKPIAHITLLCSRPHASRSPAASACRAWRRYRRAISGKQARRASMRSQRNSVTADTPASCMVTME